MDHVGTFPLAYTTHCPQGHYGVVTQLFQHGEHEFLINCWYGHLAVLEGVQTWMHF